jgi:predicted membrane protein
VTDARGPVMTPHLFVGLFIITVGVLVTLDNLGLADTERFFRYWPVALILVGLQKLAHSREGMGGAFGGFVITVAGVWLLLEEVALVRVSFWDLWPMLLVFFGGYLVWQGATGRQQRKSAHSTDTVSAIAVLGGVARGNNSRHFQGGTLTAVMGGCELDLRHAAINGDATIDLFALWGGIEIRVPEDWTVIARVTPLLGGFDDKTRPPQGLATHRLTLRGTAIMGGIEVKN